MTATAPRVRALALLREVDRGRRLDLAWEDVAGTLSEEDRGWVHELLFGTIRFRGRLDHLLELHLHRGVRSVSPELLRVLRLGAYQLLFMGSVPAYAAVSQSVDQGREVGGRKGAGLVNGVLRSLEREGGGPERFPSFSDDPAGYLTTWGSHPRWLVDRWLRRLGPESARQVVEAGNRIPGLYLRPLALPVEEAVFRLEGAGMRARPGPAGSRTVEVGPGTSPTEALDVVPGMIQDPAASRVVDLVGARAGEWLGDLCAAPGGKGIGAAASGARLIGCDLSPSRLRKMRDSLRRLGMTERLVVARGETPPFRSLDVVLVDAPCTGTATLARHPDARWRLGPDDPDRLATVQARILKGAGTAVRPGGRLIYSTCTLEAEENWARVEAFLRERPDFALDEAGLMEILPGDGSTDGAFAARMKRKG